MPSHLLKLPTVSGPVARISLTLAAGAALACAVPSSSHRGAASEAVTVTGSAETSGSASVPPPLQLAGTAYEAAADVVLPDVPAGNYPGLHNVFRLSDRIISGSEPVDEEALSQLAAWGVRTVLSVDGKAPDAEAAARHGIRYVHVPLQYKGISTDQIANIAKTFRELEAPFYVHCFHGKHRGPAAAAIGRVALEGLERDRAIAEMRQWSSTASKYEGLYASVATATIPTCEETEAHEFDFASGQTFDGVREIMIGMTRAIDEVKIVRANGWRASADHPDVDSLQSVTQLAQLYSAMSSLEGADDEPDDFREMLGGGQRGIDALVGFLTDCRQDPSSGVAGAPDAAGLEARIDEIEAAYDLVVESCLDCHSGYRNGKRK